MIGIERAELVGGSGANIIDASAFSGRSVTIRGLAGNDEVYGGRGNDLLSGGGGQDTVVVHA